MALIFRYLSQCSENKLPLSPIKFSHFLVYTYYVFLEGGGGWQEKEGSGGAGGGGRPTFPPSIPPMPSLPCPLLALSPSLPPPCGRATIRETLKALRQLPPWIPLGKPLGQVAQRSLIPPPPSTRGRVVGCRPWWGWLRSRCGGVDHHGPLAW